jgi:hypothetical protein
MISIVTNPFVLTVCEMHYIIVKKKKWKHLMIIGVQDIVKIKLKCKITSTINI